jgi:RNA polymerase sigma-70 factor (ECF subfamily)
LITVASPQLLQRCREGDARAIEELVSAHRLAVYRLALSILDDPAEADEAAQDALLRAIAALKSYRGDAAFKTWLYAITLNVCRGRLRQRRARERLTRLLSEVRTLRLNRPAPPPEEAALQHEADAALWEAIHALSDSLREPIILRYYHELSIAEVARVTGVSERTVHNRLSAAHQRLRILLTGKVDFK